MDEGKWRSRAMGNFDGAELCVLVGLYILHILAEKYGKHRVGLYCDEGLTCFECISGLQADRRNKLESCQLPRCNPKSDKW